MSSQRVIFKLWNSFGRQWGRPPAVVAYAPGRINLIGDHTDYNGGLALPAPINRWIYVGARQAQIEDGPGVRVYSAHKKSASKWLVGMEAPEEDWMRFVQGAYLLWSEQAQQSAAFELFIQGNIPQGVGLSSSAALGVALLKAMFGATGISLEDMQLCKLAQRIEHEFLSVETGLMDQMAVVFGRRDKLLEIDFKDNAPVYHEVPPFDLKWVIIDSGMRRELAHSGYQERVDETRTAFAALQEQFPALQHPRDLNLEQLEAWLGSGVSEGSPESSGSVVNSSGMVFSKETLFRRMRHFVSENDRVGQFIQQLKAGDLWAAGDVLDASHASLRDDYESSVAEVDLLQSFAVRIKGCMGSRIMGGGFGGCTINMLVPSRTETFLASILAAYKSETGIEGRGYIFDWSDGAGLSGSS